ncbi:MAG TPA: hypothetical protein VHQ02_12640 [Usitatibacter sp.]|jgi:hypothetical protein|nr:hypothetical protein [Usitatibacter sp.]
MDTTWSLRNRPLPRVATVAKVLASLLGVATLAGIYPAAAALATALAVTWRTDRAEPAAAPPAPIVVSAGAAERNSLGLRTVLSHPPREE